MFENVLIAEDHESASISVRKTLNDLQVPSPRYAYYCDDALEQIKQRIAQNRPFDLLITDLYFEEDQQKQSLSDGMALIAAVRKVQPDLRILVFSAEHRPAIVTRLFDELHINGYVRKARFDVQELKIAIGKLDKHKRHVPLEFRQNSYQQNAHDFSKLDLAIVTLLSQGIRQKDIPEHLKEQGIIPSSLSSVEKRLNLIKDALEFTMNEQLIAHCKDMGLI
ncbi:response regulator transcription factor [Mucilaginibacter robiniae]|uniref:Response regulator transcription factor n=1 Tax=Mucilaginibacter robiniae TaxID=2728022 RepID=A0A7L5DXG4_9SPHI|nr:response regulator [Mucilaginibacter robiniae]QJD95715.1 response regulator transcription factor [Mucilaginibacter robiniae]